MTSESEVKRAILKVAGNPDTGVIRDLADEMARAIVALDAEPTKEIRVMKAAEKR